MPDEVISKILKCFGGCSPAYKVDVEHVVLFADDRQDLLELNIIKNNQAF